MRLLKTISTRAQWVMGGVLVCLAPVVLFQNCQKVQFSVVPPLVASSNFTSNETDVETNLNTPVDFVVNHSVDVAMNNVVFKAAAAGASLKGTFTVIDAKTFKVTYNPGFGFRGKDAAMATVLDKDGNTAQLIVNVTVGNPLQYLEPALAVRGMGCVQCHASIASNIVTDFGYRGDGAGNDYFFSNAKGINGISWNLGGVYGDHGPNFSTISLPAGANVYVPSAVLPPEVVSWNSTLATLADYLKFEFGTSSNAGTKAANVVEESSIYIGAPKDADLVTAFELQPSDRFKYFKNTADAVGLAGLNDRGQFFQTSNVLTCEGDLAIRGPLYIENMQITSKTGCRIYVIGSVFLFGPVTFTNTDATRNLEIMSSKSISMGLGSVKSGSTFCEPASRWATSPTDASYVNASSLLTRYTDMFTVPSYFVRQSNDPLAFGRSILAEANVIQSSAVGPFKDASCRPEGRAVSYDHLLLNAPIVHSRYQGNVSGTVIAEIAIMSLDTFKFQYDPVFNSVPIFPFVNKNLYLNVKE